MDDPLDIIRVFDKWYNHYQNLLMEKNEIAEKNTILEAEIEKLLKRNESLYRDLNGVQEVLGNVQNHAEQIISLKELNRKLKVDISRVEQELKTQAMEFKKKLEMETKLHEDSLIQTTTKIEREAQGRQAELLEVIEAKEKEIALLTEQIKNMKREAEDQKTSLSMEHYQNLLMEKNEIAEKNTILEAEIEKLLKRNESLYRDLNGVQEVLGNVQNHAEQIISLKELNRKLKVDISRVEQELKTQAMEFKKKLEMETKLHEDSLIQTTTKIEREAQGRQAELLEVIEAKEKEIALLTEQIKNMKREAEDQKTSLSMEYESKLLEIQRQNIKLMKNNEEAANREKLQKKMQHIKEKYEHEISTLNQKIFDLEGKLYSSTTNTFNSMHRNTSINAERKRKI